MVEYGNLLLVIFLTYYSTYFIKVIFNKKYRKDVQFTNSHMDNLRSKKVKTLEEQKNFINLKYPKSVKEPWTFKRVGYILFQLVFFIFIFQAYFTLFSVIGISIKLWEAIIFVMVAPIIFNIFLQKFNLQKSDLNIYLR